VWIIKTLTGIFSTSAAVANRFPRIQLDDGTTTFAMFGAQAAIAASQNAKITYAEGIGQNVNGSNNVLVFPLPTVPLQASYRIVFSTIGLDVADQWGSLAMYVYEMNTGEIEQQLDWVETNQFDLT
jgi:hypothetical protein